MLFEQYFFNLGDGELDLQQDSDVGKYWEQFVRMITHL